MATDLVLESGQKVQVDNTVEMAVRKPNHLYVESYNASHLRELTYDGKTLTMYGEPSKYYASVPTGKTIAELIDVAATKYGIELPLADLFFWGSAQEAKLHIGGAHRPGTAGWQAVPALRVQAGGCRLAGLHHRGQEGAATQAGGHYRQRPVAAAERVSPAMADGAEIQRRSVHVHTAQGRAAYRARAAAGCQVTEGDAR